MRRLSPVVLLLCSLSCRSEVEPPGGAAAVPSEPASDVPKDVAAEVVANMDRRVDPCSDFYQFACGGWLETTELPADEARFGRFNVLRERNKAVLRDILASAAKAPDPATDVGRLGQFYASCMDENAIEQAGTEVLAPMFSEIEGARDAKSLMRTVGLLHRRGVPVLLDFDVGPDYKQPDLNVAHLSQGGLGLPDRDYYLDDSEQQRTVREAYRAHVVRMLELSGDPRANASADAVLELETRLARAAMPRDELRDPNKRYNRVEPAQLTALAPKMPWSPYFEALGYPELHELNVAPAAYFGQLSTVVATTKPADMQAYLRWHVVHRLADHLPEAFVQAHFEFYGKTLSGQQSLAPRWKRCVQATDSAVGELLGQIYVAEHFAGDSRGVALDMIEQIEQAFAAGLPQLSWMDDTTRTRAREKMEAIVNKIGYPDAWKSYEGLTPEAGHLGNVVAAYGHEFDRRTRQVGRPVDKGEWHMTPPTVNAYYNPPNNEMVFPAGILQPPFFHPEYPMAMNFGGIGMVMGHELTHGFDDQGRKFDGQGRLTEWWEAQAVERFEERASCVQSLYEGYEVQPGLHLNGKLTLGENIADFGGIKQSYAAYRRWAETHDVDPGSAAMEGLSREQLFFVAYGQLWCTQATEEIERVLALTDPHAHPRYRVNGPLSNLPEFWDAFSCEAGETMRPANVCEVW